MRAEVESSENNTQAVLHFPGCSNAKISAKSLELREKMYADDIPYRHKFNYPGFEGEAPTGNRNIPLFSVFFDGQGIEHRYNYLQCRYFYCHYYEKLVEGAKNADFEHLKQCIQMGMNLQIVGYDGYKNGVEKSLWEHYNDTSRPFGHELVLYTLLTVEKREDYPWNRFYRENAEIYEGVIGN